MTPWFSASALAVAARRANAAGVVRLTCTPEGLEIELIRITGFALGFAPGAVAEPTRMRVPYTAVRGLVREGKLLYLALDPALVKPYSRFALARFSEDEGAVLTRASEARARMRWASLALPLPVGLIAAALVRADLAGGALGRAAVGALAALVTWAVLRELASWQTWGGPPRSDREGDRRAGRPRSATRRARAPPSPHRRSAPRARLRVALLDHRASARAAPARRRERARPRARAPRFPAPARAREAAPRRARGCPRRALGARLPAPVRR